MNNSPFMKKVRDTLRFKQMALATEKNYCYWISFFIRYHGYKSSGEIKSNDATVFLSYLAVSRHVLPNTQNQAFNALLFLFRHVLNMPLDKVDAVRAKEVRRIPVLLTNSEVQAVVDQLNSPFRAMIQLAWRPVCAKWRYSDCVSRMSISSGRALRYGRVKGAKIESQCFHNASSKRSGLQSTLEICVCRPSHLYA